jgi:hypothetical protein
MLVNRAKILNIQPTVVSANIAIILSDVVKTKHTVPSVQRLVLVEVSQTLGLSTVCVELCTEAANHLRHTTVHFILMQSASESVNLLHSFRIAASKLHWRFLTHFYGSEFDIALHTLMQLFNRMFSQPAASTLKF